jgi:hypothetical protein
MPLYRFHIENGPSEELTMELPSDAAAIKEGLRTAAGLVGDLSLSRTGIETHRVEVSDAKEEPILKVEIRAVRSR